MGKPYTPKVDEMDARHRAMLAYQETIKPFPATLRELGKIWFLSMNATWYTLQKLEKDGRVVSRSHGRMHRIYYAVEPAASQESASSEARAKLRCGAGM